MSFHDEVEELLKDVPADCILRKARDVHSAMLELITAKAHITAAFPDSPKLYSTAVLKADLEKQFFILDEFKPTDGHDRVLKKEAFTLRTNVHGIEIIVLDSVITGAGKYREGAIYKVPFPSRMVYMQRRGAFRVIIRSSVGAKVSCTSSQLAEPMNGSVLDLSATGAKLSFRGKIDPQIAVDTILDRIEVEVPEKTGFDCKVEVRFVAYIRDRNVTMCGVRFLGLDAKQSQQVTVLVNDLEREARRAASGIRR